jgi:hypothetical protein
MSECNQGSVCGILSRPPRPLLSGATWAASAPCAAVPAPPAILSSSPPLEQGTRARVPARKATVGLLPMARGAPTPRWCRARRRGPGRQIRHPRDRIPPSSPSPGPAQRGATRQGLATVAAGRRGLAAVAALPMRQGLAGRAWPRWRHGSLRRGTGVPARRASAAEGGARR